MSTLDFENLEPNPLDGYDGAIDVPLVEEDTMNRIKTTAIKIYLGTQPANGESQIAFVKRYIEHYDKAYEIIQQLEDNSNDSEIDIEETFKPLDFEPGYSNWFDKEKQKPATYDEQSIREMAESATEIFFSKKEYQNTGFQSFITTYATNCNEALSIIQDLEDSDASFERWLSEHQFGDFDDYSPPTTLSFTEKKRKQFALKSVRNYYLKEQNNDITLASYVTAFIKRYEETLINSITTPNEEFSELPFDNLSNYIK